MIGAAFPSGSIFRNEDVCHQGKLALSVVSVIAVAKILSFWPVGGKEGDGNSAAAVAHLI